MDADRKSRVVRAFQRRILNPLVRALAPRGLAPGHALVETRGRSSGLLRRVPVGYGLRGRTCWVVAEHGRRADWVRNVEANPSVRVLVKRHWHRGTAHVLDGQDPESLYGSVIPRLNSALVKRLGTDQLVVRIDLDATESPASG
jgi:deazaflavin-dependent oxidoreductase (nitroreductase family)